MDLQDFELKTCPMYEVGGKEFENLLNAMEYREEIILREVFLIIGKLADKKDGPNDVLSPRLRVMEDFYSEEIGIDGRIGEVGMQIDKAKRLLISLAKASCDLQTELHNEKVRTKR